MRRTAAICIPLLFLSLETFSTAATNSQYIKLQTTLTAAFRLTVNNRALLPQFKPVYRYCPHLLSLRAFTSALTHNCGNSPIYSPSFILFNSVLYDILSNYRAIDASHMRHNRLKDTKDKQRAKGIEKERERKKRGRETVGDESIPPVVSTLGMISLHDTTGQNGHVCARLMSRGHEPRAFHIL